MNPQQIAQLLRRTATDLEHNGEHILQSLRDQTNNGIAAQRYDRQGGRPGNHPDPTYTAATTQQTHHQDDLAGLERAMRALTINATIISRVIKANDPNPKQRPEATKPCLGGIQHYPDPEGRRCHHNSCQKPWPCRDGETESWFEDCRGRIDPTSKRCALCELHADSMVCRDCNEIRHATDARSGICGTCRKRRTRNEDAAA